MKELNFFAENQKDLDYQKIRRYISDKHKDLAEKDISRLMDYLNDQLREISKESLDNNIIKSLIQNHVKMMQNGRPKTIAKKDRPSIKLSDNSKTVLEKRYLKKDSKGMLVETPEDMLWRITNSIADFDHEKEEKKLAQLKSRFFEMMSMLDFLPNSPTIMNAGTSLQQLSACFVLPIKDSMEDIFETIKNAALIHKSGGGTGFSFSRIRPANDMVLSTKGVSSGPVSFMKVFNSATETIKQGGRRRGANMAILRVDHPDILDFINSKKNTKELNNFNISVALTEEFMEAVEFDEKYSLVNPRNNKPSGELKAREVFELIVNNAYETGEPGIIFLDRINKDNITPSIGEIESTNPCGEQPLLPYESCNLGSINLANMVITDKQGQTEIDWDHLKETIHLAVRFLDNVIDANRYPLDKIREVTLSNRKIGLGIMGFADLLFMMGLPYNSQKGISIGEKIMKFVRDEAIAASQDLAEIRGPFPNWNVSTLRDIYKKPLRNATLTTIAPTGTLSIIANCSSGIEPLFSLAFERNVMDNTKLKEIHPYFNSVSRKRNFFSESMVNDILKQGSIQDIEYIPQDIKKIFVTAMDISPKWHVKMQAAFQKYTDNAVSKTVNFPEKCRKDDVKDVFKLAYKYGCKGVTIYRQNSRPDQVLQLTKGQKKPEIRAPRIRPDVTFGRTARMRTGCGNLYITINEDDKGLSEVFIRMGKTGGCISSYTEAIGRLISLALRSGVDINSVTKQLKGIRCPNPSYTNNGFVASCSDAIRQALVDYLNGRNDYRMVADDGKKNADEGEKEAEASPDILSIGLSPECPECGSILIVESNCLYCRNCGYSKCP